MQKTLEPLENVKWPTRYSGIFVNKTLGEERILGFNKVPAVSSKLHCTYHHELSETAHLWNADDLGNTLKPMIS